MSVFKRCSVVMLALVALQGAALAAPFTDVLDVPAMPSALASSSALRDVTLAGQRLHIQAQKTATDLEQEATHALTPAELQTLTTLLRKVYRRQGA